MNHKYHSRLQLQTVSKFFLEFVKSQQFGGILLLLCTFISIAISNFNTDLGYINFWHHQFQYNYKNMVLAATPEFIINDGLMSIFFLLVGIEIKRELLNGELSTRQKATLPLAAALGGMLVPALIFILFNVGLPTAHGWAIPMATDIAFALGILGLVGKKVPVSLKVFITALAVVDDLGAIAVIGIFYSNGIDLFYALISCLILAFLLLMNRLKVNNRLLYFVPGIVLWYTVHHMGVHATLSGVLLAFTLPAHQTKENSSLMARTEHVLHSPVNFIIMPLFALANTCIVFNDSIFIDMPVALVVGIVAGLCLGKPLGILLFSFIAVKLKWASLPRGIDWRDLTGAGLLGGIGFTMSVFITLLAFNLPQMINVAKIAIVGASLLAGISGFLWLKISLKKVTA